MKDLASKLSSVQFVSDISLIFDILQELSLLSLSLHKKSMTLDHADRLVKRTNRVMLQRHSRTRLVSRWLRLDWIFRV